MEGLDAEDSRTSTVSEPERFKTSNLSQQVSLEEHTVDEWLALLKEERIILSGVKEEEEEAAKEEMR